MKQNPHLLNQYFSVLCPPWHKEVVCASRKKNCFGSYKFTHILEVAAIIQENTMRWSLIMDAVKGIAVSPFQFLVNHWQTLVYYQLQALICLKDDYSLQHVKSSCFLRPHLELWRHVSSGLGTWAMRPLCLSIITFMHLVLWYIELWASLYKKWTWAKPLQRMNLTKPGNSAFKKLSAYKKFS